MFYVRFLKAPQISSSSKTKSATLKAVITLTTDLGDSFYPYDVSLRILLINYPEQINYAVSLTWKAYMRACPVTLEPPLSMITGSPVRIVVRPAEPLHESQQPNTGLDLPLIVPAWSSWIQDGTAEAFTERRLVYLPSLDKMLGIWEEAGESIARHIWDAGVAMSHLLTSPNGPLINLPSLYTILWRTKPLNIIELGCGCGLVGLTAIAVCPPDSRLILTDLPAAEAIARRNIGDRPNVSFEALDWEDPRIPSPPHDLVLVSDCTYNADSSPALVACLSKIADLSADVLVLVAMKVRHESENVFFELMTEARFEIREQVQITAPHGEYEVVDGEVETIDVYCFKKAA